MSKVKAKRKRAQIVRRADGKIVGRIIGDVFIKRVKGSRHFLQVPPAIANDLDVLAQAKDAGARIVEIIDRETGKTYRATLTLIWRRGFTFDRKHGRQIGLPLAEWATDGQPTADQMVLPLMQA